MANLDREMIELLEQIRNRVSASGAIVGQLIEISNSIVRTNVLIANLQALPDLLTQTNALLVEIRDLLKGPPATSLGLAGGRIVPKSEPSHAAATPAP